MSTNRNDISKFRKEQKKKKNLRNLIVILIVILVVFMIYLFKDTIFQPLEGIATRIGYSDSESGFPIKAPGSAEYTLYPMDEYFALLTDSYVITYGKDGRKIGEFQHGFLNPVMSVKGDRILVFDKGNTGFKVYSKTKLVYESSSEENIVYARLGNNRNTVLVTNASYYMNYVIIYDENGNKVYTYKASENVVSVEFSRDDDKIYISQLGSDNGDFLSSFSCYDLSSEGDALWSSQVKDIITYDVIRANSGIVMVNSNSIQLYSELEGKLISSYNFSGELVDYSEKDGKIVLLLFDNITNTNISVLLDKEMNVVSSKTVNEKAGKIVFGDKNIALLCNDSLIYFDENLDNEKTLKLDDEYSEMIYISQSFIVQGVDSINRYQLS